MPELYPRACHTCSSPVLAEEKKCSRCGAFRPGEWPKDPKIGQRFLENLVITRRLGFGATGSVYLAEEPESGGRVAVKFLYPTLAPDEELVKRFRIEAAVTKSLNIPQVVQTFDFGVTEDGTHYMTMEYVEGRSLAELLAYGPLDLADALEVARQVLMALEVAHRCRVIHRDLKPGNLLLTRSADKRPLVKILDFGFARVLYEGTSGDFAHLKVTRDRVILGTPLYMSPEQVKCSRNIDGRADLYSVGVILYQMVTGVPPFNAENPMDVLEMHLTQEPKRPSLVRAGIPQQLDAIVLRLLAKEPKDRYQTAGAVLEDLDRAFPPSESHWSVDEISAGAARPSQILRKVGELVPEPDLNKAQKNKRKPAVFIVVALAVVVAFAVTLWWLLR